MNRFDYNRLLSDTSIPISSAVSQLFASDLSVNDIESGNKLRLGELVQYVYEHAEGYTADQLYKLICKGFFSFDLLLDKSRHLIDPSKKAQLCSLCGLTKTGSGIVTGKVEAGNDKIAWQQLDKRDRFILHDFVTKYPTSVYVPEARDFLMGLRTDFNSLLRDYISKGCELEGIRQYLSRGWITKQEFVGRLKDDKNLLPLHVLKSLLTNQLLTITDISSMGFSHEIMKVFMGGKVDAKNTPSLKPISQRVRKSDDYYFWGTSGSGKSCALGAIMSAANGCVPGCSMTIDYACQGASYIEVLKDVFKQNGKIGVLPPGTPVGVFAEMGFTLSKGAISKPITCIDMAGGMLDILAQKEEQMTKTDKDIQNNLVALMKNAPKNNKCTHVFLLEYKPGETKKQSDKLDKAIDKINKLDLLAKTQGILVLVTKVDKMNVPKEQLSERVNDFVDTNYKGFINNLKFIAEKNRINGGRVDVIPFNIGRVEMQNYCIFDAEYAAKFVNDVFLR